MSILFKNNTPWRTEDLEALILPGLVGSTIASITVDLLRATPGRRGSEQRHAYLSVPYQSTTALEIEVISPKRCAKKADPLSRLSLVGDLKPHETILTEEAVGIIAHALESLRTGPKPGDPSWVYNQHLSGQCECPKARTPGMTVVVHGDTKIKTQEGPSVTRMERALAWREKRLAEWLAKASEEQAALERLRQRIAKKHEKAEKAMIRAKDRIPA